MGLIAKLKGELIDIIEWLEYDDKTIAYRFDRYGNEIKNGAKLTVREGQKAIFVNEGQIADIFDPGMYELTTKNLPILSTLKGWAYGFQSPFKAEVIFITDRIITGFGWGTPSAFRIRDPEFGILEITARGNFSFKILDAAKFLTNVVGTQGDFTKEDIVDRLRKKFVTEAISAIAASGKSFYEMAGHYDTLSTELTKRVELAFHEQYGLSIVETMIQSIDLTEKSAQKVENRDDTMFNDNRMDNYERRAKADALKEMAGNPGAGGMGANMMGMMAGMAAAGQMGSMMGGGQNAAPPPPPMVTFHVFIGGQQAGPFNVQQIIPMIQSGQIKGDTQVWKAGMPAWAAASTIPDLMPYLQSAVPPPPPPVG